MALFIDPIVEPLVEPLVDELEFPPVLVLFRVEADPDLDPDPDPDPVFELVEPVLSSWFEVDSVHSPSMVDILINQSGSSSFTQAGFSLKR